MGQSSSSAVSRDVAPPSPWLVPLLAGAAFLTYFCTYALRKPFAASTYGGVAFLDSKLTLKTALVVSQLAGYTIAKYLGMKVCSEARRGQRPFLLIGFIAFAETSLILFALLPGEWKVLALFLNGLPLGMVWGLLVAYLEGRRTSKILLACLSCSYIVSSGAVKDVGLGLLGWGVSEDWMPAAVGAMFLPAFLLGVWILARSPAPSSEDVAARVERSPMDARQRWAFLGRFWPGVVSLLIMYFFLTAFRDFRDSFQVDLLKELNLGDRTAPFSRTEVPVTLGVLVALALLYRIQDNRRGMSAAFFLMIGGLVLIGAATWLRGQHIVDGFTWMLLIGLGVYLAYVPVGSILFDRLIASTRFTGTAVFAIYLADAVGYTGSFFLPVLKDLGTTTRLEFFDDFCLVLSVGGAVLTFVSWRYFVKQSRAEDSPPS